MSSSWKLGKKIKDVATSHRQPPGSAGSIAPSSPAGSTHQISSASVPSPLPSGRGTLTIRIIEAKGLTLPPSTEVPEVIRRAIAENPEVGSLTVGSLTNDSKRVNRESQRKQSWWLPYLVLGFDKNEVLVECLGGTIENPVWMYKADFDVSRASEITLSAYLRTAPSVSAKSEMGDDLFLGGLAFLPSFDAQTSVNAWHPATSGSGGAQFHLQVGFKPSQNIPLTIDAFELLQVIGKGSFGKVMQVRKKDTGRIYAMKTIRKAHIVSRSEVTHTLAERTVLGQVNNPFIVPLKFSFQNAEKLYLVLSCINGGELFHHLQKEGRFSEERARLYAAELLCALEHLHAYDVIYRDLKPENILLDYTGHIALCDFGLCKLNMGESEKTNTFCGTPEYLSPELLLGNGYSKTVDWWTLGVLVFEMLSGLPPYYDENVNEMYRKILTQPLRFGDEIKPDARSLLTGLLTRDPAQRLGNNGAEEIKRHAFFAKIDWKRLMLKQYTPSFKPSVESAIDTSNFDSEFTSEAPMDSVVEDSHLSETVQQQFIGFTYNPTGEFMGESVR